MTTIITIFCCFLILTVGFFTGLQFGKATAYSEGYADALRDSVAGGWVLGSRARFFHANGSQSLRKCFQRSSRNSLTEGSLSEQTLISTERKSPFRCPM